VDVDPNVAAVDPAQFLQRPDKPAAVFICYVSRLLRLPSRWRRVLAFFLVALKTGDRIKKLSARV
jgi:hypothetical protein